MNNEPSQSGTPRAAGTPAGGSGAPRSINTRRALNSAPPPAEPQAPAAAPAQKPARQGTGARPAPSGTLRPVGGYQPAKPAALNGPSAPPRAVDTGSIRRISSGQAAQAAKPAAPPRPTAAAGTPKAPAPKPTPAASAPSPVRPAAAPRPAQAGPSPAPRQPSAPKPQRPAPPPAPAAAAASVSVKPRRKVSIVKRVFAVFGLVLLLFVFAVISLVHTLVTGPSETMRDQLVLSAMQASATKWLPGLFLDSATVEDIMSTSADVQEEVIQMGGPADVTDTAADGETVEDEWANAIDGMIYKNYSGSTFKAYILLVRDPSRVYVGTASDYHSGQTGMRIFDMVAREGAVAAINGGEFADIGGTGSGDNPMGLTYSRGSCVWDDGALRTFIGFDSNGVLHVAEPMTRAEADAMGIRDAVSFQNGNVLITNDGENVTLYYAEGNVGLAQRTAIGQRADGTVILAVTDGRSPGSLGANRNDVIDMLVSEGAVVAGMLDGGSSAMMYYADYYTKYPDADTSNLDEYQQMGLLNHYKAFTRPRRMPTYFLVAPET